MSWNFTYVFVLLYHRSSSSVVNLRHFWGVMPLLELRILEIHSFPHFSLTCFYILSWNFAYDFVLLYYRSSSSVVNLRQLLWELCPFWNLEYWKYTVFRIFLLHALTYWAEILHMTLFYCTTDQIRVSSICVNFCRSYRPFWNLEYWKYTVFCTFSYMFWHTCIELKFCIWLCFTVLQIKFECCQFCVNFCGSFASFGTFSTGNTQFSALFSYMLLHIELNFFIWLCLMYYRSSLNVVTLCPSIFCTFLLYTCIYKLSWNLKFDIGFFNEFLLEKY